MTLAELQAAYDTKHAEATAAKSAAEATAAATSTTLAQLEVAHAAASRAHARHQQAASLGDQLVRVQVAGHWLDVPASVFLPGLAAARDEKIAALQALLA